MRHSWFGALFPDLNSTKKPKNTKDGNNNNLKTETDRTRWKKRHTLSPPKRPVVPQDYDIANHARASLQIDGRTSSYLSPGFRTAKQGSSYEGFNFPEASGSDPGRPFNIAAGSRQPLYAQEVPRDGLEKWRKETFFTARQGNEFIDSRQHLNTQLQSLRTDAPLSVWNGASQSAQQIPVRPHSLSTPPYNASNPLFNPYQGSSRINSAPGSSLQTTSTTKLSTPARSFPNSPSSPLTPKSKANQCHGTTGAGKRCTRVVGRSRAKSSTSPQKGQPVTPKPSTFLTSNALRQLDRRLSIGNRVRKGQGRKLGNSGGRRANNDFEDEENFEHGFARITPIPEDDEDGDDFEELPIYCFQHAKQTLEQKGTFVGTIFVDFDEWIPNYLPQETKLHLRHEISKPISPDDLPGYIYVHEMAGADTNVNATTFIKLGRSVKPVARLSQWQSQCRSRQPIVRDIFPLHRSHPLHPKATASNLISNNSPSRMHSALLFDETGTRNHHRWERLCLIEVAGIAALHAGNRNEPEQLRQKCSDCGKIHVELFLLNKGSYEREIRDVVLRWQRFVETFG